MSKYINFKCPTDTDRKVNFSESDSALSAF